MRVVTLLLALLLAGCAAPAPGADPPASAWREQACEHPWPCGDGSEWPLDLATPADGFAYPEFGMTVRIPMDDGIELDGAVWIPELPEGARPPVVVWATPYAGQCRYSGFVDLVPDPSDPGVDVPDCDEDPATANSFHEDVFAFLTREGYATAMVSMRGTGLSGGCFDLYGPRGQADMARMAQWFGEQEWSNGRVAMWGVSAMGTTPFMAAIGAPPALKTIAPSGIISDLYLNRFSPQGAPDLTGGSYHAGWSAFNSLEPPLGVYRGETSDLDTDLGTIARNTPTRLCEGLPGTLAEGVKSQHTDTRDEAFWSERRLVHRFGDITASVFIMPGFQDFGHAFQDDVVWDKIASPKRMLMGQWGHDVFFDGSLARYSGGNETTGLLVDWFDFWLKGLGEPPRLGVVDVQDSSGAWRETSAWPPPEARPEMLYLAAEGLATAPGGDATFRASGASHPPACGYGQDPPGEGALVLGSEPLTAPVTIAGNPMAWLELTSDQAGGAFALTLYDVDPSGACVALVSEGGVDLRFHEGNAVGQDFPTGAATPVRVDLFGTAHRLDEGHVLRAVFSMGESGTIAQPQYAPELAIGGASHLVLPLVDGTLGGEAPTMEYPPRPFA